MSHKHIRVRKQSPQQRGRVLNLAATLAVVLIVGFVMFGRTWRDFGGTDRPGVVGRVLETRIAVAGTRESDYGGSIWYRIDAHVQYDLRGQMQDRWIPASDSTTDRGLLLMKLAKRPSTCQVSWAPRHPDHPRCALP